MDPAASLWAATVLVLTGVALGLGLTLYGALRAEWRLPRGLSFALDILVVLAAAVPVAVGLAIGTWGTVRLWALVGLALGLLLWAALAAPAVGAVSRCAARLVRRAGRGALRPLLRLARLRPRWLSPKIPPLD